MPDCIDVSIHFDVAFNEANVLKVIEELQSVVDLEWVSHCDPHSGIFPKKDFNIAEIERIFASQDFGEPDPLTGETYFDIVGLYSPLSFYSMLVIFVIHRDNTFTVVPSILSDNALFEPRDKRWTAWKSISSRSPTVEYAALEEAGYDPDECVWPFNKAIWKKINDRLLSLFPVQSFETNSHFQHD